MLKRVILPMLALALGVMLFTVSSSLSRTDPAAERDQVASATAVTGLPLPPTAKWVPNPFLAEGSLLAVVAGSPQQPGAYAMRITFPAGFRVPPHTHPDERLYTVLSGTFEIGLGTTFDSTAFKAAEAGAVVHVPANTPHFHRASRGAVEFQVNGVGPSGITYLDSLHDPRRTKR